MLPPQTLPGLRTLLIAPRTDLPNADAETQRVNNNMRPQLLMGQVETHDVIDTLPSGEFDIVWFLGHSTADGLQLSDGVITASHFVQLLRPCAPQLVVLNSCSTLQIAMQIQDSLQCAVICTVIDVPDLDAYVTGAMLSGALRDGLEIPAAYEMSKPASNRTYVMLNGKVRLGGETQSDDTHRLLLSMYADMQRDMAAMRQELVRLNNSLVGLNVRFHPRLTRGRLTAWIAGYVLFALAGLLLYEEVADYLGLRWYVAFGVVGMIDVLAGLLLVFGLGFTWDVVRRRD